MTDFLVMLGYARLYFFAMALVMLAGGIMGLVKAGSTASLVAGALSAALLALCAGLLLGHPRGALITALLVCFALAGRFVPALLRGKRMPAAYVVPLAVIGAAWSLWLLISLGGSAPQ